jgi:glycosyltransferase involved in cell wall biosynthesis
VGDPLISVVTPVYNGEKYLRECIESVLAQTYSHWDYTIVNNCSTDGTLDIAREYAAKDPRIRIHNNDSFLRVVANYNNAFRQISPQAKYCKVVAADDWIFPECLQRMARFAEDHPGVSVVGAYNLLGSTVQYSDLLPYHVTLISGREACRRRLLGGNFGAASSGLFLAEIVRRRPSFYNEANLHADSEACFEFFEHHDFGFVHQVLTFRRERDDSLTSLSERINTYLPNKLAELATFGPRYLSEVERQRQSRELLGRYYRYLGKQAYELRDRHFWAFHKKKLAEAGIPLSRTRLAWQVVLCGLDLVLNPKQTIERAVRRLRRTSPRSS